MTAAIAHMESDRLVLDAVRERKAPFSPASAVEEFSDFFKTYNCSSVCGDRYAGKWPREQFDKAGIHYRVSEKSKSDLYRDFLPILNSARVELLDNARLVSQLCGLERRTARGGRDSIDHAPGAHDDVINSAAGAILAAGIPPPEPRITSLDSIGHHGAVVPRWGLSQYGGGDFARWAREG